MVETYTEDEYFAALRSQLREALNAGASGRSVEEYASLLQEVKSFKHDVFAQKDQEREFAFCHLVESLTGCVSDISDKNHEGLISELYTISLWECSEALRNALLSFMLHLVLVNGLMMQQTLQVLVHNLNLPFKLAQQYLDVITAEWKPSEQVITVQDDIIHTLETMMQHAPSSSRLLTPILARGVPNIVLPRSIQCTYLRALFCIAESSRAIAIRDTILAAVVQHLVCLDVEIRWQDIIFSPDDEEEEEEEEEEEVTEQDADIFELEGQTEQLQLDPSKFQEQQSHVERREGELALERVTGRGGFEGEATDNQPSTSGKREVDETAEKLDSMMLLVFQHLRGRTRSGQIQRTRQALLDAFFATILNTHKSKFTQYLLWYLLDQDPEHSSGMFLKRLQETLADPRQPDITRSAAAAYIASFLARAAFLPEHLLLAAVEKLAGWCMQYCLQQEGQPSGPRTPGGVPSHAAPQGVVHQVFYAACQGLLYVLCYRLEQLMASKPGQCSSAADSLRRLFKETVPVLLRSRLAPMAVCLPTVVGEFTRLAGRLDLMDCRAFLPGGAEAVRCQRPLEMFFPFDPYLLRRSAVFLDLKRTFVRWKQGHSQAAGEETEATKAGEQHSDDDHTSSSDSDSSGLDSDEDDSDASDSDAGPTSPEESPVAAPIHMPISRKQSVGKRPRISLEARNAQPMVASYSSTGTGSPACPMSWTPNVPEKWAAQQRPALAALDVHD